jgi:hypothetical protein
LFGTDEPNTLLNFQFFFMKFEEPNNKNTIKKPINSYNSQGEGGEAHWPARGGRD